MNSQKTREGTIAPARFVLSILCCACLLLSSPGPAQAQDIEVAFGEIATLGAGGVRKAEFLPGEEIQVWVSMWVLRSSGNPFVVRLRISGDGWYEVRTSDPISGLGFRSIPYFGLSTAAGAARGKVSLVADIFSQEETVSLRGRRHAYLTIQCPEAIPGEVAARLQVGRFPFDMALTADGRFLYVTSQQDPQEPQAPKVTVIEAETRTVVQKLGAAEGIGLPAGVAPSPGGGEMLVADSALQSIHVIRADAPFDLLETIPLNANGDFGVLQPGDLASYLVGSEVYVTDSRGGARVFRVDLASRQVQQILLFTSLSVGLIPIQIMVDPPDNPRFIYVLCQAYNEVLKLDVFSGELVDYVRLRNAGDPSSLWPAWSMALNAATDEVYVLVNPNRPEPPDRTLESKIYVVPKNNLSGPVRKIGAGSSLWDLTVRQDGLVYAIDSYRGEILVIDMIRGISLERCAIPVGPGGRLLRLDPVQNRLFVGNWAPGYVDIVE